MKPEEKHSQRDLIDQACRLTGLSLEELAQQLEQKTLARYRRGEFALPADKRKHIQALVLSAQDMGVSRFREVFLSDTPQSGGRVGVDPESDVRLNESSLSPRSSPLPPPHTLPRSTTPDFGSREKTPHENYAEAVQILGNLLEKKPEALEALMFTLRTFQQSLPK